jgi:FkbM family methyltransferase
MKFILKNIKITRFKLLVAKVLYFIVKIFVWKNILIIKRNGINFEIDLNEGIDLHLFLFGSFQKHIYENKQIKLSEDSIIFDVGANSGVISLFFAQKVKSGIIHAFEPTDYATKKNIRNQELNPSLKEKIILNQCFVSSVCENESNIKAFSSWPIISKEKKHGIHQGVMKSTNNISSITLDKYCETNNIHKLDLIKIDTDGHEFEVFQGAEKTISKFRPQIIFELGIYVMSEKGISFKDYANYFEALSYRMSTENGKEINNLNYLNFIPKFGTIDIIALPR